MFGFFLAAILSASASSSNTFQEGIVAKVGSKEIITTLDVELTMEALRPSLSEELSKRNPQEAERYLRKKATDYRIERALVAYYNSTKPTGEVKEVDVDTRLNLVRMKIREQQNISSDKEFREWLEKQGMTFDSFRARIKQDLETEKFASEIRGFVHRPDDQDVLAYYKQHASELAKNPEYELASCLLAGDPKVVQEKASQIQKKPEKFKDCVKASGEKKPKTIKVHSGVFNEQLEEQIFAMKKDQVAAIPSNDGIQLFKVIKIKQLSPVSFNTVKDKLTDRLYNERIQKEMDRILTNLKSDPDIVRLTANL